MTKMEYDKAIEKIEKFDELSHCINDADVLINALECGIEEVASYNREGVAVELCVNGKVNRILIFSFEQATKLKEIMVSYRSDVCKRREEL